MIRGKIHWVLDESDKYGGEVRDPRVLFEFADKSLAYLDRAWPENRLELGIPGDRPSPTPKGFSPGDLLATKLHDFVLVGRSVDSYVVVHAPHGVAQVSYWDRVWEFRCTKEQVEEGLESSAIDELIVTPFMRFVEGIRVN